MKHASSSEIVKHRNSSLDSCCTYISASQAALAASSGLADLVRKLDS